MIREMEVPSDPELGFEDLKLPVPCNDSVESVYTQSDSTNSTMSADSGSQLSPELRNLYSWLDTIPFQRPKRNLPRDFSDASKCAEMLSHFFPRLVEMHNYPVISNTEKKVQNWTVLNRKVLSKLNCKINQEMIHNLAACVVGTIEQLLLKLKPAIERKMQKDCLRKPSTPNNYHTIHQKTGDKQQLKVEELLKETKDREDTLRTLNNRMGKLVKLLKKKDDEVEKLNREVQQCKELLEAKPEVLN